MAVARAVLAAVALSLVSALGGAPALASCAPPVSVAEYAQRADAVVHGRVIGLEGGAPLGPPGRIARFQLDRVLKGSVAGSIVVLLGPEVDSAPGTVGATSVDYNVTAGTDHTLYLRAGSGGRYVTDACSGSHSGAPSPEEVSFFGAGSAPQPGVAGGLETSAIVGLAAVAALAVVAGAYALRLSRRRAATKPS